MPLRTHCKYIAHLYDGPDVQTELLCRFMSFYFNILRSENPCVKLCAGLSKSSNTPVGINCRILNSRLDNDGGMIENESKQTIKKLLLSKMSINVDHKCIADVMAIKELSHMIHCKPNFGLNNDEIVHLLQEICVN